MLKFTLPIKPQVKQRARIGKWGAFTPRQTVLFERTVASMVKALMGNQKPLTGPLKLSARFIFKPAKKPSRSYPSRGDTSNFLKALEEACNGVLFLDDVQLVEVHAVKFYDMTGGESRIEMTVEEITL